MDEWKSYKLGDLYEVHNGLSKSAKYFGSGFPFLSFSTVFKHYFLPEMLGSLVESNDKEQLSYSILRGDVFITRTSETAEELGMSSVALKSYPQATYNGFTKRLRPIHGESLVYPEYIGYYFRSPGFRNLFYALTSSMSTRASLANGDLLNMEIILPSLYEQKRIATVLRSLDMKIDLNNRINHNLEEQAQALYKSWFVDFEPFKGGKFVDSELGMIPEGWRVLPFLSVARLCSGGTPKTDHKEFWNGSIPFFTPKDVGDSAFCLSTEKTITEEGLKNCNSSLYKAFTTFITARGTVGKLCMAGVPMAMNQTNYAICPASNIDVITLFLITKQLINSLRNKANGAVFDAVTTRDFDGEKVTIAPQGVMDTFSSVVHPIYESILQNEMKNASLSQLRDSLLPKLMSGDFITSDIPC